MPDLMTLWSIFKDSTTLQAVLGALIGFLVMQVFQQRKTAMPNMSMDERFMPGYRGGPSSVPMPGDLPFGPGSKSQKKQKAGQAAPGQGEDDTAAQKRAAELERKLFEMLNDEEGDEDANEDNSEEDSKQQRQKQTPSSKQKQTASSKEAPPSELRRRRGRAEVDKAVDRGDKNGECEENSEEEDEAESSAEDDEADRGMVPYSNVTYPESEMLERATAFFDMLNRRRSCRQFSDRPVDAELLKLLVRAAGTSPSGAHTEPWTYVCVTNRLLKRRIREIVEEEEEINYARRMGPAWKADLARLRTGWEKPYLTEAPVIVVLMRQVHGWRRGQEKRQHYYSEISVSISAGLFLAAVQNVGLCTLTSTPMNAGPALRRLLGRPLNEKVHLLLPLGYAADTAEVPDLARKPVDKIMVSM